LVKLLREAVDAVADEEGWSYLGSVGQQISMQSPSFDSRNYGYAKLGSLVRAIGLFDIDARPIEGSRGSKAIYIKHKLRGSSKHTKP
jgi:hypothetical protein